jgi:hypothetical protein
MSQQRTLDTDRNCLWECISAWSVVIAVASLPLWIAVRTLVLQ